MPYHRGMRRLLHLMVLFTAVLLVGPAAAAVGAAPVGAVGALGSSGQGADGDREQLEALYITSGLTWPDITEADAPNLTCFARSSSAGTVALTSDSVMTTKRQGWTSLATGRRAPVGPQPSPTPQQTKAGVPIRDLGSVANGPGVTDAQRRASIRAIDAEFEKQAGRCGGITTTTPPHRPAIAVASIGMTDPPADRADAAEEQRDTFNLEVPLNLQVVMDSRWATNRSLTSTSTRQQGLVTNLDLAEDSVRAVEPLGTDSSRDHAEALTLTARAMDDLTPILVAVIGVIALVGAVLAALGRTTAVLTFGLLAVAAGLTTSTVPWPLSPWPAATVLGYILVVATVGLVVVEVSVRRLLPRLASAQGRGRRVLTVRGLDAAAAGAVLAGVILLDSLTGSRLQLASLLGNQPLYGGRFYGMSNHLTAFVLAGWAMGLIALLHAAPQLSRLVRTLVVGVSGLVVLVVSAAPQFGADAGSSLIFGPVLLLAVMAAWGVRLRPVHVLVAGAAGAVLLAAVAALDASRGAGARTHLGDFAALLVEDPSAAASMVVSRTVRMLEPLWLYPVVAVPGMLIIVALTVLAVTSRRVSAWDAQAPLGRALRTSAVLGAWIGALTNDTGLALLAAAFAVGTLIQLALLPRVSGKGR